MQKIQIDFQNQYRAHFLHTSTYGFEFMVHIIHLAFLITSILDTSESLLIMRFAKIKRTVQILYQNGKSICIWK